MRAGQRGAVLITGIILIVVIALMVATLGFLYVSNLRSSSLHSGSEQAYFAAFSGLERATRVLNSPTLAGAVAPDVNRVPCASLTGDASVTAVTLVANKGQFTVTGGAAVYPATPVTLNGALNNVATVIPVTTLAALGGYSASGRIMIDRELIDYSGTSNVAATCGTAPCFVGARRGGGGTTAAAHATGTRVGQFQCNVQSTGAVPDLANPRAQRILSQGTQIHEAWSAGACTGCVAGQQPWISRFQQNAWSDFSTAPLAAPLQVNSISMLSYADGFAVGNFNAANNPFVLQWNGAAWNAVPTSLAINRNLNAISCISANDCWAVGVRGPGGSGQRPWIVRWNGAWSSFDTTAINVNRDLNGVYCVSSAECYAVGVAVGGNQPFTVRYDGTTWAADNNAFANADLFGVHCAASNDCWAVGAQLGGNALIARWTGPGPGWANGPAASPAVGAQLNSVFCVSTNDCWAVGNVVGGAALILRWTGPPATNWTRFTPVPAVPAVNLNAVSCVKTDDCWIVGNADAVPSEVILHWSGSSWTRIGPSAAVGDRDLLTIGVLGASQRAPAARREVYP
jgi:hypothetical protein